MGKRPRSRSPAGIQPTAMKALRAQGVSLEVIAGASQLDVAEVERILEQEEPGAQERVVLGWKHRNPLGKGSGMYQSLSNLIQPPGLKGLSEFYTWTSHSPGDPRQQSG